MMNVLTIVCAGLFVTAGASPAGAEGQKSAPALAEYRALKARSGKGAADHVRLALWCEQHGLEAERSSHLAKAMLLDPDNPLARGLAGLVKYQGRWVSPQVADEAARGDQREAKSLSEYNARRSAIDKKAADEADQANQLEGQGKPVQAYSLRLRGRHAIGKSRLDLGLWCEKAGLMGEAEAEFVMASHLNPKLDLAWKHLGFIRINGQWVSADRVAAARAEAKAQADANARWEASLKKWRSWLREKAHRDEAVEHLDAVTDPRAIPAVGRVFMDGFAENQRWAIRILDRIESPESTRALATMAVFSGFDDIRKEAIKILKRRPAEDFAPMLVAMIHTPATYATTNPQLAPGTQGQLVLNTARYQLQISYDAPSAFIIPDGFIGYAGYDGRGVPIAVRWMEMGTLSRMDIATTSPTFSPKDSIAQRQTKMEVLATEAYTAQRMQDADVKSVMAQQRMASDIQAVEQTNAQTLALNSRVGAVLTETLDAPPGLKDDEDGWNRWWYDRAGYSYETPEKVYIYQEVPNIPAPVLYSCFVAGTQVRTLQGPRPIESIRPGDRVLSQDTTSGALDFQPVTSIHHNPPIKTVRLALSNGDSIVPSIYHRFWIAGRGWALARDLKAGDLLRSLDGTPTVSSAEPGSTVPVFNLDVARHHTYFVGDHDNLVHDNTPPESVTKPFDTMPGSAQ